MGGKLRGPNIIFGEMDREDEVGERDTHDYEIKDARFLMMMVMR